MPLKCSSLTQFRRGQKKPGPLLLVYFMLKSIDYRKWMYLQKTLIFHSWEMLLTNTLSTQYCMYVFVRHFVNLFVLKTMPIFLLKKRTIPELHSWPSWPTWRSWGSPRVWCWCNQRRSGCCCLPVHTGGHKETSSILARRSQRDVVYLGGLTNSALVYEPKCGGGGGCGVSDNEYSCPQGAQINFGDLTLYLTYWLLLCIIILLKAKEISWVISMSCS